MSAIEGATIHERFLQLQHAALATIEEGRLCDQPLVRLSYDCILDALDAIYKECNGSSTLSKDKYIARFLKKCKEEGFVFYSFRR